VGSTSTPQETSRTLILHWNGRTWTRVASPSPGGPGGFDALNGVTAISARGAWAVGSTMTSTAGGGKTLILHWAGSAWTTVPAPSPDAFSELSAVAAASADDVWGVGGFSSPQGAGQPMALHCC
jgi:hypothetical protein